MMAEYIDLTKDDGIDLHIISSEESNKYVVIHFTDTVTETLALTLALYSEPDFGLH